MEIYFEVPFYRDLTKVDGWEQLDKNATKYQVARVVFKMIASHMPGSSKIGRKFDVMGAPDGVEQERLRVIELETETFQETKTIERSIIESNSMIKIMSELSAHFGDGKIFKVGGKVSAEIAESIKLNFQNDFHITNSLRVKNTIRYEFKDSISKDCNERVCGAAIYQKCRADLYILKVDFLNLEYKTTKLGLRKKLSKYPFPDKSVNKISDHPNIIHVGIPIAELQYWELLPRSSVIIKDADYVQEVENDADIMVKEPMTNLKSRPYWNSDNYPSLYQLSRVAFPFKWVNKKQGNLSKDELMELELGEAEESGWWYQHGPGRTANK